MSNEIMTISGVSCYENDGTAYLSLEAVARGLGFTKTDVKISETSFRKEYVRIDWPRVEKYLAELGFSQKVAKDSFIPENIFYRSPTQRASDLGLFKMHERTISSPDGEIRIRKTTKVTGKGQRYFTKKFLGQSDIRTTGN